MELRNIEVFGRDGGRCIYCTRAEELLKKMDLEYVFYKVDENKELLLTKRNLEDLKGQTIPQIFIDGKYVGGFDDLKDILL